MDPLTQGVWGAALPQSSCARSRVLPASLIGALSGMAPDLDVFIRSQSDPLLFLEFHRQFTHSLLFIPIGALICTLVLHPLIGKRFGLSFRISYLFAVLGYATHALLDACTTYGTMLLWPLTDARFAWNSVSVIDPLFTLPILVLVVLGVRRGSNLFARLALAWGVFYLSLGWIQRDRATEFAEQIAAAREHNEVSVSAKPSFANLLVWKTVYEYDGRFYVDAVRAGWNPRFYRGSDILKLDVARDFPWLDAESKQAADIERFRWFSSGYVARDPIHRDRVIDVRYSMIPNQIKPLWSIELNPLQQNGEHADYITHREMSGRDRSQFFAMLLGRPLE